jgi:hypothetical protein
LIVTFTMLLTVTSACITSTRPRSDRLSCATASASARLRATLMITSAPARA